MMLSGGAPILIARAATSRSLQARPGEGAEARAICDRPVVSTAAGRAVEEVLDIVPYRRLERREPGIVAGALQLLDRGLREILVAVADRGRHVDIFDVGRAAERRK